jgi:hypothetical protein
VDRDVVAGGNNLGRQRGPRLHLLAGQEERGLCLPIPQQLEDRWRSLRVRAIVEGQGDRALIVDPIDHPQRAAQRRYRGGEARRKVPHGHPGGEHADAGGAVIVPGAYER